MAKLSRDNILKNIGQDYIFGRYICSPTKKKVRNPLRKDNHPGCTFRLNPRSNRLIFTDWATGKSGDCFYWVQEKFGVNFYEALQIIEQDFGSAFTPIRPKKNPSFISRTKNFDYIKGDMTPFLSFWRKGFITEKILNVFNVEYAEEVYLNGWTYDISTPENPIFAYNFPSGRIKFYKPFEKDRTKKFFGNTTKSDINGLAQLTGKSDTLIITKSLKDVMSLFGLGYEAVAPQSETHVWGTKTIEYFRNIYKNVILLFDNDGEWDPVKPGTGKGKECTKKYFEKYELPYFFLPEEENIKDVFDLCTLQKKQDAQNLISQCLNEVLTQASKIS